MPQLTVGGTASGAVFDTSPKRQPGASGAAKLMPRLHRDYDSGLSLGLDATLAVSDPLSRGRYGGDFFEKALARSRTGLGRLEIGQTDGAGYAWRWPARRWMPRSRWMIRRPHSSAIRPPIAP